jgi:hypothetical protein
MNTLGFVASIHGIDTLRFRVSQFRVSHSYNAQGRGAEYCGSSMKRIRMRPIQLLMLLGGIGIAASQSATDAIVTNLSAANWTHEKGAEAACSWIGVKHDSFRTREPSEVHGTLHLWLLPPLQVN